MVDYLSEADTRAKLIDPALHNRGWYDILADIGFGASLKSRKDRVESLLYKHDKWLSSLPKESRDTLLALARQFEKGGTEELENPYVFNASDVAKAGGLEALKILGNPKDIIDETKRRLFAV